MNALLSRLSQTSPQKKYIKELWKRCVDRLDIPSSLIKCAPSGLGTASVLSQCCLFISQNKVTRDWMKAEFSLLTRSLALSCLKKTPDFSMENSSFRTADTNAFLKGEIHLSMEHHLKHTNTNLYTLWISFYPEDKSAGPDSLNSICVPETFGSGGLQTVNKERTMKRGHRWNLGHLDLHLKSRFCKLLWATLMTLRALTERNKPEDKALSATLRQVIHHRNEIFPNQTLCINLWRENTCLGLLSTRCFPLVTVNTSKRLYNDIAIQYLKLPNNLPHNLHIVLKVIILTSLKSPF